MINDDKNSIQTKDRSEEYTRLLVELRNSCVSAAQMAVKLYEQGKKDGLSNEEIRNDIEIALDGVVKERRLREILPAELKRSYTHALTPTDPEPKSALNAESITNIAGLDTYLKSELGLDLSDMPMSNYDEISDKALATIDGIRAKLIPDMCDALHREQPRLKGTGIKTW